MTLHEYDVVALTEEIQAIHKETSQPILLRPGQVGTILMSFDDRAYLVDFADAQGNTYAMETISSEKLMELVYEPLPAYSLQIILYRVLSWKLRSQNYIAV